MQWVLWMLVVSVLGIAAVAASGRLGGLPSTVTDTPRPLVPDGLVTGADLRGLRFAVVPRGYSMEQVDQLLDRLAAQLETPGVAQLAQTMPVEGDLPFTDPAESESVEQDLGSPDGVCSDPARADPITAETQDSR